MRTRYAPLRTRKTRQVRISAKVDYGIRALLELATNDQPWMKGELIAAAQELPLNFVENILRSLKIAGMVEAHRGADGGYRLAIPADQLRIGDVIRALEGPLAAVQGLRPDQLEYHGSAAHMREVWLAVRSRLRSVLDETSLADVIAVRVPAISEDDIAPRLLRGGHS